TRSTPQGRAAAARDLELERVTRLGLLLRDDDRTCPLGEVEVLDHVERCEVLAPQWIKRRQRDHQTVPVADGIRQRELRPTMSSSLLHELLAEPQKLQARDRRSILAFGRRRTVKPRLHPGGVICAIKYHAASSGTAISS